MVLTVAITSALSSVLIIQPIVNKIILTIQLVSKQKPRPLSKQNHTNNLTSSKQNHTNNSISN